MAKSVKDLKPSPSNPRKISKDELKRLAKAMAEYGDLSGIVFNRRTGHLVGGHQRCKIFDPNWKIIKQDAEDDVGTVAEGHLETPWGKWLYREVDWGEKKEAAANIAANQQGGSFDIPLLKEILTELDDGNFDLDLTGFGEDELKDLIDWESSKGKEDEVPEPPRNPITRLGDMYVLGNHRLLCGDSTNMKNVARLTRGEDCDAVLTDPPYGINQKGVPGDEPQHLHSVVNGVLDNLPITDAIVISFASTRTFPVWLDTLREKGHKFERMLWMYKAAQCTYPWRGWILKSESILVSSVGKGKWQDVKPYSHDCYYLAEVSGELPKNIGWHGSVKPMAVVEDLLKRMCPQGALLYDPFLGSGTCLIAAEKLDRRCFGIEIEPAYCDVIIKRWEAFTRGKAVLQRR